MGTLVPINNNSYNMFETLKLPFSIPNDSLGEYVSLGYKYLPIHTKVLS